MSDSVSVVSSSGSAPEGDLPFLKPGEPVDVTNCEREPIHIPGRIQPHGVLIALRDAGVELIVTQISANTEAFWACSAESLLGKPLASVLGDRQAARLRDEMAAQVLDERPLYLATLTVHNSPFDAAMHRAAGGELILELEPSPTGARSSGDPAREGAPAGDVSVSEEDLLPVQRPDYYALVRKGMQRFLRAKTVTELGDAVAAEVRHVSDFDRVMIYRFDADGHGSVIAEAKRDDLPPFLGLHYPASDIPPQARRLYLLNPLRVIVDVSHTPAPLVPALSPLSDTPLDMSQCILRSPSPIHIEYLKNMGVSATLTISLIVGGELWGLIACHHGSPMNVPYDVRAACEFLGQVTSLQLAGKQEGEDLEYRAHLQLVQARLVEAMSDEDRYQNGLAGASSPDGPTVLDFLRSGGAAVFVDGECVRLGTTPPESFIRELVAWLSLTMTGDIWATDTLSASFVPAERYQETASGVLAMAITRQPDNYLLWFRPEVVQTVDWAGDPAKAVTAAQDGSLRLSPRNSFELWKGTVRGRSLPWQALEREAAADLRRAIVEVVLKKAEQIAHLNVVLARSNRELDDFAYIASHDLKEPLRGIHNYAHFLQEDYAEQLDQEGQSKLETLGRLTERMEGLIDSLLDYSRAGRLELNLQECDMNTVVANVLEDIQARLLDSGAQVRIPRPLPCVVCDPVQVSSLLGNLIVNAAKYNDHPRDERWIEIGYREAEKGSPGDNIVFWVRDNGIGIRERHFDSIFRLFKRLHGRDVYGGGTGAGLPIARKIAERHGGRIWLESTLGEGTTFYFTLAPPVE